MFCGVVWEMALVRYMLRGCFCFVGSRLSEMGDCLWSLSGLVESLFDGGWWYVR